MGNLKLIHLSDLHLGKRVNDFSMIEDQKYILTKIINIVDEETPDGVIIAGDIYDKSVPPVDAVELLDDFLTRLSKRKIPVFVISGNHDSPERISFGGRLMNKSGIYMSPVYDGKIDPVTLQDEHGNVNIYMLPFVKPAHVRSIFKDDSIRSYNDAMKRVIENTVIDNSDRNVLITHQFVTGAILSEGSEDFSVGGTDNVDASIFKDFDYVALGHIHRPQNMSDRIRYCGTPLKYSFSEASHKKSVTVVELGEKSNLNIREIELTPLHEMVEIKGTYEQLTLKEFYENTSYDSDYMHITLTDEEDIPDAINKLRVIYHNIMKLDYDNKRTKMNRELENIEALETKSPLQLFEDFYENQNNSPMSQEQRAFVADIIEEIWEEDI